MNQLGPSDNLFAAEQKLDQVAGIALLCGALLSFVLTAVGLISLTLRPQANSLRGMTVASVLRSAARFEPAGILGLGVLVLMATPLLRVLIAIAGFTVLKWWRFVLVSAVVLILLLISFFVAA